MAPWKCSPFLASRFCTATNTGSRPAARKRDTHGSRHSTCPPTGSQAARGGGLEQARPVRAEGGGEARGVGPLHLREQHAQAPGLLGPLDDAEGQPGAVVVEVQRVVATLVLQTRGRGPGPSSPCRPPGRGMRPVGQGERRRPQAPRGHRLRRAGAAAASRPSRRPPRRREQVTRDLAVPPVLAGLGELGELEAAVGGELEEVLPATRAWARGRPHREGGHRTRCGATRR